MNWRYVKICLGGVAGYFLCSVPLVLVGAPDMLVLTGILVGVVGGGVLVAHRTSANALKSD